MTFGKQFSTDNNKVDTSAYIKVMKSMEDWNAIIDSPVPVIFQCSASWCRPCQVLRPVLEKFIADEGGKVIFYYIDIEKFKEVSNMLDVRFLMNKYIGLTYSPCVFG